MQTANGLGLQAIGGSDLCKVTMRFPSDTIPKWVRFQLLSSVKITLAFRYVCSVV